MSTNRRWYRSPIKWPIGQLKLYLISRHGHEAVNEMFGGIQRVIINSLKAVQHVMINDKHCFEMYGYDIMIDENLKPWLIEVERCKLTLA